MIAWMLYSAFVALVVAGAARAVEWLARVAGYSVRWIWIGALALTMTLSLSAAVRGTAATATTISTTASADIRVAATIPSRVSWSAALGERIERLRSVVDAPIRNATALVRRNASPAANVYVGLLTTLFSVGLVLVLLIVGRRFRRARRQWPLVSMQGVHVRLAPRVGPAVIGLVRPEIVVPRWLLDRHADDQRLVVAHEAEHVRARDPLLLGFAWSTVAVAPWNPALWYMMSRLRLAIELDCDARVLRRGAAPRSYGTLLIDVAQHASGLRASALALADGSSHLHQRILAMKPSIPRFARLRGGLAAAFALTGLLVACEATLPTDAEIAQMDVATATRTARELTKGSRSDTAIIYTVDGRVATSSEAKAIAPADLGSVQIVKGMSGTPTKILIATKKVAEASQGDSVHALRAASDGNESPGVSALRSAARLPATSNGAFTGLIIIDGVRATESQLKALRTEQIESVEVVKGPYAAAEYKDPEAAKGVISIKTKKVVRD